MTRPMLPGVSRAARVRAYLAGAVITAGLVGVAVKAWALQVEDGAHYRAIAARQHAMRVDLPPPRGEVVDVHGRPLAISADVDSVWADPREVRDVTGTAERLADILGADPQLLEGKLAGDRRFVWIDRHVSGETAARVRAAKLPGIELAREPRRWYPAKAIAGPVIGRADIDGIGLDGIELAMNDLLTGRRGSVTALRDARGRKLLAGGLAPAEAGANVRLTLDRSIQAIAEDALAGAIARHQAKSGSVVVLDVATGGVLAMASQPTFDPNTPSPSDRGARNRAVTDVYEAGSVMKVFTVAAALEEGLVRPDTGFAIGPVFRVGAKHIRDTHEDAYLTVSEIIKRSSNIGATKIALRLGRDKLHAHLVRFGFGAKTGIELPGEQAGTLRDGSTWRDIELATISFGYGLTVTPIQMAAALAAIGNGGVYRAPRIVDEVADGDGAVLYRGRGASRQVIQPQHAAALLAMLASVFEKGKLAGTAASIEVAGFRCGGKTGTAHKYDPALKGYSPNRYLSSFAGLAPIDNPRLAIVVLIDEPTGDYYGGKVAGPVFATIASEALRYLGVPGEALPPPAPPRASPRPPTARPAPPPSAAPVLVLAPVADAASAVEPAPEPDPAVLVIPDFRGMGLGRALDEARKLGLETEIAGTGSVIAQDPAPGPTSGPARVALRFSDDARRISAPR